jgi:hypothetical protein
MSPSHVVDDPARLLRAALSVNALSTAACGLLFVLGSAALHRPFGFSSPAALAAVGVVFVAFAAFVWTVARSEPINARLGFAIFLLDAAYVAASVVFLLAWPRALSPLGWWLTLGLAEIVTVFAIAEYVGLRRLAGRTAAT